MFHVKHSVATFPPLSVRVSKRRSDLRGLDGDFVIYEGVRAVYFYRIHDGQKQSAKIFIVVAPSFRNAAIRSPVSMLPTKNTSSSSSLLIAKSY